MKILWMTWKDKAHPHAGGAELVNEELAKRLVKDGHEVTFLVGGWKGCIFDENRYGFRIIRLGNRYSLYWRAFVYYRKCLKGWADVIIDECNTIPFFAKFYTGEKTVFFIQQLAREVWFYQMPFPINLIGYLAEPIYLRLFCDQDTFTFANSTKDDLVSLGYNPDRITILKEIYTLPPGESASPNKNEVPSILFFSAFREMKRPNHVIKAFELAKLRIPNLRLDIAGGGNGRYAKRILGLMGASCYRDSIYYHGPVWDEKKKIELMSRAHFICCTSVREGWGIIVSEAGSQGTPAIVYDVNGLKDAVDYGQAGYVCQRNTAAGLAEKIIEAFGKMESYPLLQRRALEFAKTVNIDSSYNLFISKLTECRQ